MNSKEKRSRGLIKRMVLSTVMIAMLIIPDRIQTIMATTINNSERVNPFLNLRTILTFLLRREAEARAKGLETGPPPLLPQGGRSPQPIGAQGVSLSINRQLLQQ